MSPDLAQRLRSSCVQVRCPEAGAGSGVIWSDDGLIVTNAHVLHSAKPKVTLADGREFPATVERQDRRRDLALLRIAADGLQAAEIGDSSALRPGQIVTAVGNPLGLIGAVTAGVIHAVDGRRWIQADVRLAPGNSGGILADAAGRVVGINTMIFNGLALAAPSNAVAAFVSGASMEKPRFGITFQAVTLNHRAALVILAVERGGVADGAGMMIGDVMLLSATELADALEAGGTLVFRVSRGGAAREIRAEFPLRPARQNRGARAA